MCLAIPARITSVSADRETSEIDILGVTRQVGLQMVPEAKEGDWVLVHAGFAIQVVDEEFARETLEMLEQCQIVDDDESAAGGAAVSEAC